MNEDIKGFHSTAKGEYPDVLGADLELIDHKGDLHIGIYDIMPELDSPGKTRGPIFSVPGVRYWRYLKIVGTPMPGKKILLPNVGGHHYRSVYEKHRLTSDCAYGCGCWLGWVDVDDLEYPMKANRSGGPEGIDPKGECPKAPSVEILEAEKSKQLTEDIIATIRNLEAGKEGAIVIFVRGDRYQVMVQGIHPMDVPRAIENGLAIVQDSTPTEHQEKEPN